MGGAPTPDYDERRYGRDALNNTSCECVVVKANKADCFANAEVQCPKGRGDVALKYFPNTLIEDEQTREER